MLSADDSVCPYVATPCLRSRRSLKNEVQDRPDLLWLTGRIHRKRRRDAEWMIVIAVSLLRHHQDQLRLRANSQIEGHLVTALRLSGGIVNPEAETLTRDVPRSATPHFLHYGYGVGITDH